MVTEVWKKVPDFEEYEVSNKGGLRRSEHTVVKDGKTITVPAKILHPTRQGSGYYHVTLSANGKVTQDRLHRLVAKAFVPNDDVKTKTFVNHKNEDKGDTRPENLEWLSSGDNTRFGTSIARSSAGHHKPVTAYDKRGKVVARYPSIRAAAAALGVPATSGHISEAAGKGGGYSYGYYWKYKK